jgi:hypothetical protein
MFVLLAACTSSSRTVLDESFTSISAWVPIIGTPMLDTAAGNPAPAVNIGEQAPSVSPFQNELRNNTTFVVATATIAADVQIDDPASGDSAGIELRAMDADSSSWVGFNYGRESQTPMAFVDGCLGLSESGAGCAPKFQTPLNPDAGWHRAEIVLKSDGNIDYLWDGVVQGSSGSTFVPNDVVHIELLGNSAMGATAARIDNVEVTQP